MWLNESTWDLSPIGGQWQHGSGPQNRRTKESQTWVCGAKVYVRTLPWSFVFLFVTSPEMSFFVLSPVFFFEVLLKQLSRLLTSPAHYLILSLLWHYTWCFQGHCPDTTSIQFPSATLFPKVHVMTRHSIVKFSFVTCNFTCDILFIPQDVSFFCKIKAKQRCFNTNLDIEENVFH